METLEKIREIIIDEILLESGRFRKLIKEGKDRGTKNKCKTLKKRTAKKRPLLSGVNT